MFGERLYQLRKNKKWTQEELGNKIGIAKNTISCWENCIAMPSVATLTQLAEIFNVSTDYLLGLDKNDLDKIDKLKMALKEAGLMVGDDLTIEELEKALQIVKMLNKNE